ncbi:hypothetical protein Taro_046501 [Colocasia esculenta]|uniref:Pectinesterase inhibitor domain-containing protein n=1 Tax=Colocasia esculenta TaxID=4460 RepID=A0A843WZ06_COLES|nr:hypothetical protein [Colocasia esculenta]
MGRLHRHLFLITFFFAVCSFLLAGGASAARQEGKAPDFITITCKNTLYPDDCISCLSRHAVAIGRHKSTRRLAGAALRETLTQAKSASAFVNRLSSGDSSRRPSVSREAGAVSDCTDRLSNCVQLLWRSLWQIRHLGSRGTARYRYNLSNVVTLVSAALTDETTCLDGFPSSGVHTNTNAALKDEIAGVSRMTSVVLALVSKIDGA